MRLYSPLSLRYHLHAGPLPVICVLFLLLLLPAGCVLHHSEPGSSSAGIVQSIQVDDVQIGYRVVGQGEPLVMIMGYASPMDAWAPKLVEQLAKNYTLIMFDNRGVGVSTASDAPLTISRMADDTAELIHKLHIPSAHVLGWSMGGIIAQELALRHPEQVRKLVLYSTDYENTDVLDSIAANMQVENPDPLAYLLPQPWRASHPDPATYMPTITQTVSPAIIARQHQAITDWPGTDTRLPEIACPTLLVIGAQDSIVPPQKSMATAARIPGSWVVQFQNAGHGLMFQIPETLAATVHSFIQTDQAAH